MQTVSETDLNEHTVRSPYLRSSGRAGSSQGEDVGNLLRTRDLSQNPQFSSDSSAPAAVKESHPQSTVSDEQFREMIETQSRLAFSMIQNQLSRKEILELQMLRWAIAREEDARLGGQISELERLAKLHEKLASEIDRLLEVP